MNDIFVSGFLKTLCVLKNYLTKDLYYIFDIITGCSRIMPAIMDDFSRLSRKYPAWFKTFIGNLSLYFETISSDGVVWVTAQRPSFAFEGLNIEQFKQFIFATFNGFIEDLDKPLQP